MVIWLVGMSGAGKTVLGREVFDYYKSRYANTIFLDGDTFRSIMGDDVGHTLEDRKKNAGRICRMCKFLDSQGIHVVCAILSIFQESREWMRENIQDYFEVYIKVSFDTLLERDSKGLYNKALKGEIVNVVGVDIKFSEPVKPDMMIENEGDRTAEDVAKIIIENIPEIN